MHNYISCIYLTFLYCVFSNVSSNGLPDRCIVTLDAFVLGFLLCSFSNMSRRHIHTGCICLIFFHCVLSSVSSNCRPQRIQRRTGCICFDLSPLCVQKWVLKCDLPREYGITLVAFVWFFSAVCFQMPPQIACLIRCVISLVAFVSCPVIIKGIFAMTNIHHYLQFYAFFFAASIRLTQQAKIIRIDKKKIPTDRRIRDEDLIYYAWYCNAIKSNSYIWYSTFLTSFTLFNIPEKRFAKWKSIWIQI